MGKRIVTVLGILATAFMLAIAPASARTIGPGDTIYDDKPGHFYYERSCGTYYSLSITSKKAVAGKNSNSGHCAGHVWLRMMGDSLGDWSHDASSVTRTSPKGKFRYAYIKGCGDCYAYKVYP
ncbi:hypothetical protein [Streptomyces sp. CC219B]|uniref:hypothetical protein n=1 Tax=Streptomyces sp. CC219B TaxID=3044574 RepID=UPI0024A8A301|nr:hypothetical protein [Streptomyces sp. CC219B]